MNVGKTLHDQIPHTNQPQQNNTETNPRTIRLFQTSNEEIALKIYSLKKNNDVNDFISSVSCKKMPHCWPQF